MKRNNQKRTSYFAYMESIGKPVTPKKIKLIHTDTELSTTTEINPEGNLQKMSVDPGPYTLGFKEIVPLPDIDFTPVVQNEDAIPVDGKPGCVKVRLFPGAKTFVEVDLW